VNDQFSGALQKPHVIDRLLLGREHQVARMAVLWPLARPSSASAEDQLASLTGLQELWRKRLRSLQVAGWRVPASSWVTCHNCWPTMAIPQHNPQRPVVCEMSYVCPWCFARRVVELYEIVSKFNDADAKLAAISGYERLDTDDPAYPLSKMIEDHHRKLVALVKANEKYSRGMFYMLTAEPTVDHTEQWSFSYRVLSLMDRRVDFMWAPSAWVTYFDRPMADDLSAAVRKVYRYPVGLLRGPTNMSADYLNYRIDNPRVVFSNLTGEFRGKKTLKNVITSEEI
jgi:hypothetical protein